MASYTVEDDDAVVPGLPDQIARRPIAQHVVVWVLITMVIDRM